MDTHTLVLDDDLMLEELGRVRRVARRLLYDPNDADDVVQEAWLRTRTAPVRFDSRGRLRAWLAAVARRMARDTLRARRRRAAREERAAQLETRADAADVVERTALLERLLHAVQALDEPQRSTVLLRYLDGHSTAEIAAAMSVSEEVVRKRLARTCAHLRAAMGLDEPARRSRRRVARVVSCAGLLWLALLIAIQGLGQAPPPLAVDSDTAPERAETSATPAQSVASVALASVSTTEVPRAGGEERPEGAAELAVSAPERPDDPGDEAPPRALILSVGASAGD